jgi:glycine cleavage system regulatory protein
MDDLKQEQAQAAAQKKTDRQPRAVVESDTAVASLEMPVTQKPAAPNPAATPAPAAVDSRKLIRNAQLDLEVKSYQSAIDQVTALTRAAGGYVDTSNSQRGGNGKLQGTVVVKILPENLDAFLFKLRDLGEVQNQSVSTDDVTKEYFDTQARLVNSQKMELQLQDLLKRENGKVSDLLAVERELGRVRGEIEQMQGQLKLYDFQVQYATVTMNVAEKDLNQAAAYLLKEQDDFALFATDVEATFQKARTAADDFKTQVLVANLQHNSGTDVSAELTVMVPPDQVEHFLTTIRGLGRVANFTRQTQRVAKDGGDSSQPADQTRTDKDKVQVHLVIKSDDDTRKQVAVVIVAKQVDDALDMAKAATLASTGAQILGSTLSTTPDGVSKAQLSVRVPGKEYTTLMDAFRALGRQASLNIQRNDSSGPGASGDDVPVIVSLSLTDQEVPVQVTDLLLVTPNVDEKSQQIKKDAATAGIEVKASNFGGQPNGSHLARLTLMLPMGKYAAYVETLKKLGRVQSLSVQRNDRSGNAADDAPAQITLALTDDDPPVQITQVSLVANDVDAQAQQIKKQAGDAGVEIKSSSFQRQPDGTELAQMTLRLPLGHYPAFLTTLQQAGKTESLSVQRDDRPDQARPDDSAPAEIQLQLHNTPAIVPDNSGLWPTLRDTFSQGFGALFGSVKVIGVIVAFLIPWVVALIIAAWIGRRIYLWRKNR